MAQMINVTVLRRNQFDLDASQIWAVPVISFIVKPFTGTINGVAGNSLVELFPTGLNQPSVKLVCTETVTAIKTAANA
jgi:hypothetical protein